MRLLYIDCPYGIDERRLLSALADAGADLAAARDAVLKTEVTIPGISASPAMSQGFRGLRLEIRDRPQSASASALSRLRTGLVLTGTRVALWEATVKRLEDAGLLAEAASDRSEADVSHDLGADGIPAPPLDLPLLALVPAALEQLQIDVIMASRLGVPSSLNAAGEPAMALPGVLARLAAGVEVCGGIWPFRVTPGALALLAAGVSHYGALPALRLTSSGCGIGEDPGRGPDIVQVYLGEQRTVPEAARIRVLETNIDDMSPQVLDHVMGLLLAHGALDVFFTAIQMKKNRPAVLVTVLCREQDANACAGILFRETTTLGIRFSESERWCLERQSFEVQTPYGAVPVKAAYFEGRLRSVTAEYDVCHRLALAAGVPLREVQDAAVRAAEVPGAETA